MSTGLKEFQSLYVSLIEGVNWWIKSKNLNFKEDFYKESQGSCAQLLTKKKKTCNFLSVECLIFKAAVSPWYLLEIQTLRSHPAFTDSEP